MVSITLSVPEDTRELMKKFPEVNWSGFIRKVIENKAMKLKWKEEMLEKLEQEKDYDIMALEIGDKLKEGIWKRHKQKGW